MTWFRRERTEETVRDELDRAVTELVAVPAEPITFRRTAKGGGVVQGKVRVATAEDYGRVLVAVARVLGDEAGRVSIQVTGELSDGSRVEPQDLGLFVRPNGSQVLDGLT